MNLTYLRPDRRPVVGAWLVLGVSPNIYKLKATLCGLLCLRKVCPGILVWNGMQFPLGTRLGKCVPLFSWIPGCIFRLRLVGKVHPISRPNYGTQFPVEDPLGKCVPFRALIVGCSFRLRSLHSTENPGGLFFGYPGFWVVDMFDWLLVGLAALDQHDEGYHYERCSRCCCGGD